MPAVCGGLARSIECPRDLRLDAAAELGAACLGPAGRPRDEGRSGRGPADARRRVPAGDPAARRDARRPAIDRRDPAGPAHELAHVRRRDLLWSGLAGLVRVLFFFHPLVWLAHREALVAREAACDALALLGFWRAALGVRTDPPGDRRRGPGAALAMGGDPWHGRPGRLTQTEAHGDENEPANIPPTALVLGLALLAVGAAGIIPWRLVPRAAIARSRPGPARDAARPGRQGGARCRRGEQGPTQARRGTPQDGLARAEGPRGRPRAGRIKCPCGNRPAGIPPQAARPHRSVGPERCCRTTPGRRGGGPTA